MNFGGIPPGTSRIQGPAEPGLPHLLHAWLPQGRWLRLGMSHAARGQGRDAGHGATMRSCCRQMQSMKHVSSHQLLLI